MNKITLFPLFNTFKTTLAFSLYCCKGGLILHWRCCILCIFIRFVTVILHAFIFKFTVITAFCGYSFGEVNYWLADGQQQPYKKFIGCLYFALFLFHTVFKTFFIKWRVECVEILFVKFVGHKSQIFTEALIVYYFTLTQKSYCVFYIVIIAKS